MNSVLIDSNVLIYALDSNSIYHHQSITILMSNELELYISTKNISEYFSVCSKLKIEDSIIWKFYEELKLNTILLFPDNQSVYLFENLLKKYKPTGNRIYDIEIVSIMIRHGINEIATFNLDDFKNIAEINIYNHK